MEEYFISGTVNEEPYSTSVLVRKPKDPSRFSGLVAVETIHAQGAIPLWGFQKVWMSGDHAWVAVASQPIALTAMVKPYDPERYETLNISTGDSGGCAAMLNGTADAVSNEIMAQAGELLKSNLSQGPFQRMTVVRA